MPFYDYSCPVCGKIKKDVMHSMSECDSPSETTLQAIQCPKGHGTMRRVPADVLMRGIGTPESVKLLNKQKGIKERNRKATEEQANYNDPAIIPSERDRIKRKYAIKRKLKRK